MSNLITASEAGRRLDVSAQTIINWCNHGRVPGAMKLATIWVIPEDSLELIERPSMGRPPKENGNKEHMEGDHANTRGGNPGNGR
jgi:hypothetical protein